MAQVALSVLEGFALLQTAEDREAYLNRLTPGTVEHFLCCWLVAEQTNFKPELEPLLNAFVSSNPYNSLTENYRHRRKFIEGGDGSESKEGDGLPEDLKQWLTDKLNLYFYHFREDPTGSTTSLSSSALSEEALASLSEDALVARELSSIFSSDSVFSRLSARGTGTLDHPLVLKRFEQDAPFAFQFLSAGPDQGNSTGVPHALSDEKLCAVLTKLYADAGIRSTYSYQFESRFTERVFPSLTLSQLQRLGKSSSRFLENLAWAGAVVARMAPQRGVDFRTDQEAKRSYLLALKVFCDGGEDSEAKPPSYNPLRHAVLFSLLEDARTRLGRKAFSFGGSSEEAAVAEENCSLLLEFVRLPRSSYTATSTWLRHERSGDEEALSYWRDLFTAMNRLSAPSPGFGLVNPDNGSGGSWTRELLKGFSLPLPSSSQDNDLIVAALSDIFASSASNGEDSLAPWSTYMSSTWLKRVQAEARLTRGPSEDRGAAAAKWAGGLAGTSSGCQSALQSLKDKVELVLTPWNREYYAPSDPVSVSLVAKGLTTLDVKVFEINTSSYYQDKLSEIPSDLTLDGLHAHEAFTVDVAATSSTSEPWNPLRRYDLTLSFDSLKPKSANDARRGVFCIEVTGGGVSVRAVIRKGSLRLVERKTVSGHILHVLAEDNTPLPSNRVSITLAGRKYTPQGSAQIAGGAASPSSSSSSGILIPYGASASRQPLILTLAGGGGGDGDGDEGEGEGEGASDWSFSTLQTGWEHCAESYRLEASFALEREQLLKDNYEAKLLVRPRLLLHGSIPAPLGTLVNVSLTLASTDADGSSSTKLIKPFALASNKESVATFPVPPGLRRLRAKLSADVEIMANGERVTLTAEHEVSLNTIDASHSTRHLFLRQTADGGYAIQCLGKSGEPVPKQELSVSIIENVTNGYHGSGYSGSHSTDANGLILLGKLPPTIKLIRVDGLKVEAALRSNADNMPSTSSAYFELPQEVITYEPVVHTVAPPAGTADSDDAMTQVALPFRPSTPSSYSTIDPRDVRIVEVRPNPCQGNSLPCGGSGGADADESSLVVRDMLKEEGAPSRYVRYDQALGYVTVRNLPAGEYRVTVLRPYPGCLQPGRTVKVVVLPAETAQVVGQGFLASGSTLLQLKGPAGVAADGVPVNISSCSGAVGEDHLTVRVSGGAKGLGPAVASDVRLHVSAANFVPASAADVGLSLARNLSLSGLAQSRYGPTRSRYLDSRVLGEETRYVLERQKLLQGPADKQPLPGSALPRPSMLLNPWSLGPADSGTQQAKDGTSYGRYADATANRAMGARNAASGVAEGDHQARSYAEVANLDFLATPARVLCNLAVSASNGEVKISVKDLLAAAGSAGASTGVVSLYLTLVAADSSSTASTHVCLYVDASTGKIASAAASAAAAATAFPSIPVRDLSVSRVGIAADDHVIQSSRISVLSPPDGSLTVSASASNTKVVDYGSFDRVFALFMAQSSNAQLSADWSWLVVWPSLSMTEKRSRYSKNACHELHLFLFFKDQDFFNSVVRPFISGKRAKTFVDHWLLGHDLTPYTSVNAFMRLNALEKALLAARVGDSANNGQGATLRKAIAEELKAVVENSPLSPSQKEAIFKAAIASSGLDSSGPQGGAALQALLKRADAEKAAAQEAIMAAKRAAAQAPPSIQPQQQAYPKPSAVRALQASGLNEMSLSRSAAPMPMPGMRRGGPAAPGGPAGFAFGGGGMARMASAVPPPAPSMSSSSMMMADKLDMELDEGVMTKEMSKSKSYAPEKKSKGRGGLLGGMLTARKKESRARSSSEDSGCVDEQEEEPEVRNGGFEDDDDEEEERDEEQADIDDADLALRSEARDRALYRPLDKTEEFAEQHYLRTRSEEDTADLVTPNEFIADFAVYCASIGAAASRLGGGSNTLKPGASGAEDPVALAIKKSGGFVSANVGVVAAASSLPTRYPVRDSAVSTPSSSRFLLNQMLLALAVVGLPFECAPEGSGPAVPNVSLLPEGGGLKFASGGTPLVVFHQDLSAVAAAASSSSSSSSSSAAGSSAPAAGSTILCGQSYFDPLDKTETVRGQTKEKFLKASSSSSHPSSPYATFSMLRGKVYGCAFVITNVSATDQNLDVLVHLPQGAMSVGNHKVLKTHAMRLSPFSTQRIDVYFYLPHAGLFDHYPVHVSTTSDDGTGTGTGGSRLLAFASPTSLRVIEGSDADSIDVTTWAYVSQTADLPEVIAFMHRANIKQLDLSKILWRCKESTADWFAIIDCLKARHVFDEGVWSYGLYHGVTWAIKEYLKHHDVSTRISSYLGPLPLLTSSLFTTAGELWTAGGNAGAEDAPGSDSAAATGVVLRADRSSDKYINLGGGGGSGGDSPGDLSTVYYEHLEYSPLINARAHVLGEKRTIVNRAVLRQWRNLLAVLAAKRPSDLTPADDLAVVYFFLLLDRVPEARERFAKIKAPAGSVCARIGIGRTGSASAAAASGASSDSNSTSNKEPFMALQHDYTAAYLDLFNGPVESEEPITDTEAVFPVASAVASHYASYPVPKWAAKFREIASLLRSIKAMTIPGALSPTSADVHGSAALGSGLSAEEVGMSKELTRDQQNTLASAMEPLLGLKTRGTDLVISFNRALGKRVNVAAYAMDVELLFSNAPFSINSGNGAKKGSSAAASLGAFAFVRPNSTIRVTLADNESAGAGAGGADSSPNTPFAAPSQEAVYPLPASLAKKNLLLVATSSLHPSLRAIQPFFANELSVTVSEAFGRIKVCHAGTGAALPRVYVKAYYSSSPNPSASSSDSKGRFLKDGYTSASGVFDYCAISTDEFSSGKVKKLALLVSSPEYGSAVLTVDPPKV